MTDRLRQELKLSAPFRGPEQEAYLTIQRTADCLLSQFERLLAASEITATQYNVLRILRGAHGEMLLSEILSRMLTREPHMYELLARLAAQDLARAVSDPPGKDPVVAITDRGLALLARLDEPVQRLHVRQFQHLPEATVRLLIELLDEVRSRLELR